MDQTVITAQNEFAPIMLRGLVGLGSVDQRRGDLALELGLSLWMRRSRTNVLQAQSDAMGAREAVAQVAGMELGFEPIPLVGRAPKADLVNLAAYLSLLIQRAAATSERDPAAVVELAIGILVLDADAAGTASEREAG